MKTMVEGGAATVDAVDSARLTELIRQERLKEYTLFSECQRLAWEAGRLWAFRDGTPDSIGRVLRLFRNDELRQASRDDDPSLKIVAAIKGVKSQARFDGQQFWNSLGVDQELFFGRLSSGEFAHYFCKSVTAAWEIASAGCVEDDVTTLVVDKAIASGIRKWIKN